MTEPVGLENKKTKAAKRSDEGGLGETIKVIVQALLIAWVWRVSQQRKRQLRH